MSDLLPPQLVINSQMLYFGWVPKDPQAVDRLIPAELKPFDDRRVFINQYVVDREEQSSHLGAYSLTYLGADVTGLDVSDYVPARWWTHYWSSSVSMSEYAAQSGVPIRPNGSTVLEVAGDNLFATTLIANKPIIRTTVEIGREGNDYIRSHLRYITRVGPTLFSGRYPAIGRCAERVRITKLEFLDKSHDVYALAPKDPLEVIWGFYFTKAAFCYPGGFEPLTDNELRSAVGG